MSVFEHNVEGHGYIEALTFLSQASMLEQPIYRTKISQKKTFTTRFRKILKKLETETVKSSTLQKTILDKFILIKESIRYIIKLRVKQNIQSRKRL